MGSQAYTGARAPAEMLAFADAGGTTVEDALMAARAAAGHLAPRPLGAPFAAYLELHIEQGPVLEAEGLGLAVVDGIQGARWLEVLLTGRAAHAGTTPEALRLDAGDAAIRAATAARQAAHAAGDARVRFTIDLRHPEERVL